MSLDELQSKIEHLYRLPALELPGYAEGIFDAFRAALTAGDVRAAERDGETWHVNAWVKKGILLGFTLGRAERFDDAGPLGFVDKHTMPTRRFDRDDGVRVVPGGSSIRAGAYIGRDVVCMPPMFINIGAWVGDGTLIDSHALVGSCAQIGQKVHLSAAAQIGGVLEPIGALPVIVEDEVLVGGNCGVYEGTIVRRRAVLAAGTILTASTPVYDTVNEEILQASGEDPLTIPPGAVVVPGSRPATGRLAKKEGLHVSTPIIVKYRDESTDAATALEEALRG